MSKNSIGVAVAFVNAAEAIRLAITELRSIGQSEGNGYFGTVITDLERIHGVCVGRSKGEVEQPESKPVPVAVAAPVAKKAPKAKPVRVAAHQSKADAPKLDTHKKAAPAPEAKKKATPAPESEKKAALLKRFAELGGNVGLAQKWGVEALERNIAKREAAPAKGKPAPARQQTVKADKPADPIVPGCFGADGKPLTLSQVMSALDKVQKAK